MHTCVRTSIEFYWIFITWCKNYFILLLQKKFFNISILHLSQKKDKPLEPVCYTSFTAEKGILNTLNHGEISLLEAHIHFNITHALKKCTKLDWEKTSEFSPGTPPETLQNHSHKTVILKGWIRANHINVQFNCLMSLDNWCNERCINL